MARGTSCSSAASRPPVMLFGSYHLAGFMNERCRWQNCARTVAWFPPRRRRAHETEDHLAAYVRRDARTCDWRLGRMHPPLLTCSNDFDAHMRGIGVALLRRNNNKPKSELLSKGCHAFARAFSRSRFEAFRHAVIQQSPRIPDGRGPP